MSHLDEEHYRKLERCYLSAPVNQFFRPRITIGRGTAEIRIEVRPELHHAAHAAHGLVFFKALDDAAFFAVNSIVPGFFVLTSNFNLYLLRPIASGDMIARGRLAHAGANAFVGEAELLNDQGKLLARGSGTFVRSKIVLDEGVGYV